MPRTVSDIKKAARHFVNKWMERGKEQQEGRSFWEDLLEKVYGVENVRDEIEFEKPVLFDGTWKHIDVYVKNSKTVIEQKSRTVNLGDKELQSDGKELTALEQGIRYFEKLDKPDSGRFVIACNFKEFLIWDSYHKNSAPIRFPLEQLPDRWRELIFLVEPYESQPDFERRTEESVAKTATDYVRRLYKSLVGNRKNLSSDEQHSLNVFCVRWVFCLFAEDAGVFDNMQLHSFVEKFCAEDLKEQFDNLFEFLDMEKRQTQVLRFAPKALLAFPYVDGGLFQRDDRYATPPISEQTRTLLLNAWNIYIEETNERFHWNDISPTNFGCIFESTVEKSVRESGGMHYTTPDNIRRVIGPLFLDELEVELKSILDMPYDTSKNRQILEQAIKSFRLKLSSMRFLDPACGSGNFLTETYKALHHLELQVIQRELSLTFQTYTGNVDPCNVQISQFFGIEIDDFAANVAKAALWIAKCQMLQKTEEVLKCSLDILPLPKNANIFQCDALTVDWDVVVKRTVNAPTYIIGNPPFQGNKKMTEEQKKSMLAAMPDKIGNQKVWEKQGSLDFVCAWYAKAAEYMKGKKNITAAFVSTNSIVQGEQVAPLWKPLMAHYKTHILFAWKTFRWFNKADEMAHVHCVIIGFYQSSRKRNVPHWLFDDDNEPQLAKNINAYLMDAENLFIENRGKPLCEVPEMGIGNKPIDDGNYLFTKEEMQMFVSKEPEAGQYFRPWYGADEFINRHPRFCLWLGDCTPAQINHLPLCKKRVQAVIDFRKKSKSEQTRELAKTPRRFHVENMPNSTYLLVPRVSSENRSYVPMGFLGPDNLSSDAIQIVPNIASYHFGVLESRLHMAWMRIVCGRLKSDYRYSAGIVYNNFPWPSLTEEQKEEIGKTAENILKVRADFPDSSLADLYDPISMPAELLKAHADNDKAVAKAFGIDLRMSDEAIALELMRRSVKLASIVPKKKKRAMKRNKSK